MKKIYYALLLLFIFSSLLYSSAGARSADLRLGAPFTDQAVLQRDQPVPIWGEGSPGSTIAIEFAGQKKTTQVDASGRWQIHLEPMPASVEPRTLTLSSEGYPPLHLAGIVVGEVWICSGQSNMQMRIKSAPEVADRLPAATNIRSFTVENTVAFEEQAQCAGEWTDAAPDSAVAFAFAHHLEKFIDVPVGIILTAWGSSSIEAWMPRDMVDTVPHFKTTMEEFDADAATRNRIQSILNGPRPWPREDDVFLRRQPNILYNAMMHPLAPYACRGFVWYQGERNTRSMYSMIAEPWYARNSGMLKYGNSLKQWILRYREEWKQPDMHFMIVMLPGYFKAVDTGPQLGPSHPATHSWAWMRESQMQALELPHTSVINTIDLGDEKNIHPQDKLPIGQRLALFARRDILNQAVAAEGPRLRRVEIEGQRMVVHFDHAQGLTTTDGASPTGFWIAGASGEWVPAEAQLDGERVVLTSPAVKDPRYVRYAFVGKPNVNLINRAGLPAYPFRTDSFAP